MGDANGKQDCVARANNEPQRPAQCKVEWVYGFVSGTIGSNIASRCCELHVLALLLRSEGISMFVLCGRGQWEIYDLNNVSLNVIELNLLFQLI